MARERLIEKYMSLPNQIWDGIIAAATKASSFFIFDTEGTLTVTAGVLQNVEVLKDHETVKQLGNILKTNVRGCKAIGHPFVVQLGRIYLDMLNVYKVLSENISAAVAAAGSRQ